MTWKAKKSMECDQDCVIDLRQWLITMHKVYTMCLRMRQFISDFETITAANQCYFSKSMPFSAPHFLSLNVHKTSHVMSHLPEDLLCF